MDLNEDLRNLLDQLKLHLVGVKNVILTHRHGTLIQSAGTWSSKDEISRVSSALSAIFNLGIQISPNIFRYILIEGKKSKILIAPLSIPLPPSLEEKGISDDKYEFFITLITQPQSNLGGLFQKSIEYLKMIKTKLDTADSFNAAYIDKFNINEYLMSDSLELSENISLELEKILNNFSKAIPGLHYAYIVSNGTIISRLIINSTNLEMLNLKNVAAMSYSLFQMANNCVWVLKNMEAYTILLDYQSSFHMIYGLEKAIFGFEIGKIGQKLGLIRLIMPQFWQRIKKSIENISGSPLSVDIKTKKAEIKKKRGKPTELLPPTKLGIFLKLLNEEKYEEATNLVNSYDTNDYNLAKDSLIHWMRGFCIRAGVKPWESFFKEHELKAFKFEKFSKEEFLNKADSEETNYIYYDDKKFLKNELNLIFSFVENPTIWLPMKFAPLVIQNDKVSVYLTPSSAKF